MDDPTISVLVMIMAKIMIADKIEHSVKVAHFIRDKLRERRSLANDILHARELLGINQKGTFCYRSDNTHPLFVAKHSLHPDNFAALSALVQHSVIDAEDRGSLHSVEHLPSSLDENFVLVGSPTAEGLSRIVFGYKESTPDSLIWQPHFDLPYYWQLDRDQLGEATAKRYVEGKGLTTRPNWRIESQRGMTPKPFIPRTDEKGHLASDYLLITRVRNFLNSQALHSDKFIVSVGGAHGTGTRAIEHVLRDRRLLSDLSERLKQTDVYQALIRIPHIDHRDGVSLAAGVELVDATALDDNMRIWDDASHRVESSLAEWRASIQPRRLRRNQPPGN